MSATQEACSAVAAYLSDTTRARMQWGLLAVSEGLEQIERGKVEQGKLTIRMGLRFLNGLISGAGK